MGSTHAKRNRYTLPVVGLTLLAAAGVSTNAHDDDIRKLLEFEGPVFGEIWKQGMPTPRGGGFDAQGVTLLSHIPLNNFTGLDTNSGNDCWGYVSPSGREYAIMGVAGGYGFVEITDPANPVIVDKITGPSSLWHDVKVVGEYAYGVSEAGSGVQIMDMSDIDNGNVDLVRNWTSGGYSTTHNIIVNRDSGSLWLCGANIGNGGIINLDLSNPEFPQLNGGWTEMYVHDAQIVTWDTGPYAGREIAFAGGGFSGGFSDTGLRIVDLTDPDNTQTLSTLRYANSGYAHQMWLSDDRKYLYLNDELDEGATVSVTTTRLINVEDLENPYLVRTFTTGKASVDHNLYVEGDLLYQSNYTSGLRIFDALDPANPVEVAYFDTYPDNDGLGYSGAWSNYPFFPSGNVIISDINRGLFVVRVDAQLPQVAIGLQGDLPSNVNPAGGESISVRTTLREGASLTSVEMMLDTGSGYQPIAASDNGDGTYSASFPAIACDSDVSYYFVANADDGSSVTLPADAPSSAYSVNVISSINELFVDNAETNTGWSTSGDASTGQWERGVPVGGGDRADPPNDADGSGRCWLTENGDDDTDIDNGTVTLTSPALDATAGNTTLGFALWYNNSGNGAVDDSMTVQVSNNNGNSWSTVLNLGPGDPGTGGGWINYSFELDTIFANPSSQVRLRFNVSDVGDGSIVEAGVDDIRLEQRECVDAPMGCNDADLAEPFGTLNFFDVSAFLAAFNSGNPDADINNDGQFNFFDVSGFLGAFNAGCP